MRHLTPPCWLIPATPAVMEEANIMAPTPSDLRLEAPTSIEVPGATMKPIHTKMPAHHIPREVEVATATRRSINPPLGTFVITLTPVRMPVATSKTKVLHATKQRWSAAGDSMLNMKDLLLTKHHSLPAHRDFAPL